MNKKFVYQVGNNKKVVLITFQTDQEMFYFQLRTATF